MLLLTMLVMVSAVSVVAFLQLQLSNSATLMMATVSVVRAVTARGNASWPPDRGFAHRLLSLTVGLFGVFMFASYCGFLNGYLTVVIPSFHVQSVEDILTQTAGLTHFSDSSLLGDLADNPEGSIQRKIADKFRADPNAVMTSLEEGFGKVADENYAMLHPDMFIIAALKKSVHKCAIAEVPNYTFGTTNIAWAFSKRLKFVSEAFDRQLLLMKQHGLLKNIVDKYVASSHQVEVDCQDDWHAIGKSHLLAPIFILCGGIALACLMACTERSLTACKPQPRVSRSSALKVALAEKIVKSGEISMEEKLERLYEMIRDQQPLQKYGVNS